MTLVKFRVISVNARGIANDVKRRSVFDYFRKNADFLVIQETHSCKEKEQIWQNEWGGRAIFSHGTTSARGIVVLMSKENFTKISNVYTDIDGRLILFDVIENNQLVTICAIYAPNEDSPTFF